jgi:hypothetical protein
MDDTWLVPLAAGDAQAAWDAFLERYRRLSVVHDPLRAGSSLPWLAPRHLTGLMQHQRGNARRFAILSPT